MDEVAIGPVRITRTTGAAARARIYAARDRADPLCIAFCNAHLAKLAFDRSDVARLLSRMVVLNDGVGIDLAARMLGAAPFPENLNGTDFVPTLLRESPRPLRVFLLGAKPDVVARAAAVLAARYPQHTIAGSQHGYFAAGALDTVASAITDAGVDIVLCAMGNPRQEEVIATLARSGVAPVLIGVGALFDFLADAVPRAPAWIRRARLEFLFRLAQEPKRLGGRYTIEAASFIAAIVRLRATRFRTTSAPGDLSPPS